MALEQETHSLEGFRSKGTTSGAEPVNPAEMDADRAVLLRLGKKQVLKVSDLSFAKKPSRLKWDRETSAWSV